MPASLLTAQTLYAELLERCEAGAFGAAFPEQGAFVVKTVGGRRYWYFQTRTPRGRVQRYVGPESAELLERIGRHRQSRDDQRERRALVSSLVRSYGLPAPIPRIGAVVAALADAGIFRLRGVLVGTAAYQTYGAMLGARLSRVLLQTLDIDIAQFTDVSVAVQDQTAPMLEVLRKVDGSFREIPHTSHRHLVTSFGARGGLRVDFLTPNRGPDSDNPRLLPALQTAAQPLRFLDFLIRDPLPAVLLHSAGVGVRVPAPERYAVHKLILVHRRPAAIAKRGKDLLQAQSLLEPLLESRPEELRLAWEEAFQRGRQWRRLLLAGMSRLSAPVRDATLKALRRTRDLLPGIDLAFDGPPARYDAERAVITFTGQALGQAVPCAVSRDALEKHWGASGSANAGDCARASGAARDRYVEVFQRNRSEIERLLRRKFLCAPVQEPGVVTLDAEDILRLKHSGTRG